MPFINVGQELAWVLVLGIVFTGFCTMFLSTEKTYRVRARCRARTCAAALSAGYRPIPGMQDYVCNINP